MEEIISITGEELSQIEREILEYKTGIALSILEIGDRLNFVKDKMPHGTFIPWIEQNLGFSQRTANNYMLASRSFDIAKRKSIANLDSTKVVMLASLPEDVRDDFIETTDIQNMSTRELKEHIKSERKWEKIRPYFARTASESADYFEIGVDQLSPLPHYDEFALPPATGDAYIRFLNGIRHSGTIQPIIITKHHVIIDGHERVRAYKDLGIKTIKARYLFVQRFLPDDTWEKVCLRYFFDINRWTNSRTSAYYYYSALYETTLGHKDEASKMAEIYKEHRDEIDQNYMHNLNKALEHSDQFDVHPCRVTLSCD